MIRRETIRRYPIGNDYVVRVWREEGVDVPPDPFEHGDVKSILRFQINGPADALMVAKSVLAIDNVNAVEILDRNGNGNIVYRCEEVKIGKHQPS